MKRSELKEFIKGEIVTSLSEASPEDVNNQKELNKELEKTAKLSKDLGLEEANPKGEDFFYDYLDIGMSYLDGFGKKHSLDDSQLEKLGKKIVDQLYKGDVGKAYDAIVKRGVMKEEIPSSSMLKINNNVKSAPSAAKAMIDFFNQMAEKEQMDFLNNAKFKIAIDKLKDLAGDTEETPVTEDEDKEPSKADLKKTKGLAKAKEELALLTREMKSLAKKYSKAEGEEKEKLVKVLKDKTKLKKELEAIIDK